MAAAASMDQAFVRSLLSDAVLVPPQHLGGNFRDVLLRILTARNEGVCSKHGYIMPGSIALHVVDLGQVQASMLNGSVRFNVRYWARVFNPTVGMVLEARVVNTNRFGVLAHAGLMAPDGTFTPVVEAIIAKQVDDHVLPTLPGALTDLDGLEPGQVVRVQVLGRRAQLSASTISVVGAILKPEGAAGAAGEAAAPGGAQDAAASAEAAAAASALPPLRPSGGLLASQGAIPFGPGDEDERAGDEEDEGVDAELEEEEAAEEDADADVDEDAEGNADEDDDESENEDEEDVDDEAEEPDDGDEADEEEPDEEEQDVEGGSDDERASMRAV